MSAMLNIQEQRLDLVEKNSAYYLSSITVAICLLYLFAMIYSLIRYRKRLNEPLIIAKMSYLT